MNGTRRNLLRYLSFGAVGAATPVVATQAMAAHKTPVKSDAERDGPVCVETLSIRNGTKPKPKKPVDNNKFVFSGDTYDEYKQISMAVGKDGNLWLKSEDGIWKRVVTE